MIDLAVNKLKKELTEASGDNKVNAVKRYVADALKAFCRQDEEFAQAIVQSKKTLGDCCKAVMANCGSSISDLEVYRRAVQFYFPGADIRMEMTIDLCASVRGDEDERPADEPATEPKQNAGIVLDLTDFL